MNMQLRTILLGLLSLGFVQGYAQTFALQVKDDRITYLDDEQGNRILDFSYCGYKSSEQDIPDVRNTVFVSWTAGDNTARIQLLTMSPHWFLMLPVSEEPFYWIRENFHYPKVFV